MADDVVLAAGDMVLVAGDMVVAFMAPAGTDAAKVRDQKGSKRPNGNQMNELKEKLQKKKKMERKK